MKGIILAGGKGTRLYPATAVVSKHLLPVYDKPLIYYPLSVLLLAGIHDILIISAPEDHLRYKQLLGDGRHLGITLRYIVQEKPRGIADALLLCEDFIGDDRVCLILGDNVLYGRSLQASLLHAMDNPGATIFAYPVEAPSEFGVVELDHHGYILSIEEKPEIPKSNLAVPGLYFFDHRVMKIAKTISPSPRGELEITAVNQAYLRLHSLRVEQLESDITWLDAGTPDSLLHASMLVKEMQARKQGYIACIEEIAWQQGFISTQQLLILGRSLKTTAYGQYLISLAGGNES